MLASFFEREPALEAVRGAGVQALRRLPQALLEVTQMVGYLAL